MELGPYVGALKVGFEQSEISGVVGDFAALESVPGAGGREGADVVVYVADGDGILDFVVEDCLERGYDLRSINRCPPDSHLLIS